MYDMENSIAPQEVEKYRFSVSPYKCLYAAFLEAKMGEREKRPVMIAL
jgi:hypothetical protein